MMQASWKVIVADELGITRRALASVMRADSAGHEVWESGTADGVLQLLTEFEATLLLVDLMRPGLDLVRAARERLPGLKIVVLAGYDQPADSVEALQAGADGFLVKGMQAEELMTCLRCVVDTGVVVTSRVLKKALDGQQAQRPTMLEPKAVSVDEEVSELLTPREREIFDLMAQNCSNKEIAAALHIAEQTVKVHVSRILTKLGQPNRAQAVIHGVRGPKVDSKVVHFRNASRR